MPLIDFDQIRNDLLEIIGGNPISVEYDDVTYSESCRKSMANRDMKYGMFGPDVVYDFRLYIDAEAFSPEVGDIITVDGVDYRVLDVEHQGVGKMIIAHMGHKYA